MKPLALSTVDGRRGPATLQRQHRSLASRSVATYARSIMVKCPMAGRAGRPRPTLSGLLLILASPAF
ncbi:hypothetical protein EVAR_38572_1 [Eumeta japonica]|uniref:Uncharacterized protein n=1 Tax=Eumeta variegata TaxID=151549 RepID=A0A4C1WSH8_EUMVA|nr:hypothetical protein EVAR_38572_1 [Eumeta japonica]